MVKKSTLFSLRASLLALLFFSLALGQTPEKKLRIVSLAPNWTNVVASVGAADELVGVTRYCIFPDSIPRLVKERKIQVVGGLTDIDASEVEALHPDVILTSTGLQLSLRKKFLNDGFKVVHMDEASLTEVYKKILDLGKVIGKEENARRLVDTIKTNLKLVVQKYKDMPRVSVYYEINYAYKCVPGKDSYITELIKMAGGEPIFSDRAGIAPAVKWEEVVKANPDVILIPIWDNAGGPFFSGDSIGYGTTTPYEIAHRPGAQNINAVRNGRVRYINSAKTKQAGPLIPTAADLFGKTIHAPGDTTLLKTDKVPEHMETTFSFISKYLLAIYATNELLTGRELAGTVQ